MTVRNGLMRVLLQEDLNFLVTNRLPRRLLSRFMGWFSGVEQPLVSKPSIALWRFFADVDMSDAANSNYRSLRDAFTRSLLPDARPIAADADLLVSPCDAIVGAHGVIEDGRAYQVKGSPYTLSELAGVDAEGFESGRFVTLRLTAGMYHRFHAPHDLVVESVNYISGDTWNVNPIALKRVERLFCRNERAVVRARLSPDGPVILIVAVAAILVAGIRFHFLDVPALLRGGGPRRVPVGMPVPRGAEMGWFEHGSTIIVFAPERVDFAETVESGRELRVGEPLFRLADDAGATGEA
ncbi:archaetidylserine decarboxylase [Sphingoaurantiacus capsulatus]|uniref:phosphatidylserine decarboxylase n=1 Tax=Sphingoaurantiacus capsulatus TaxID=1771310 RepID=A0ABV7XA53_9SPHN